MWEGGLIGLLNGHDVQLYGTLRATMRKRFARGDYTPPKLFKFSVNSVRSLTTAFAIFLYHEGYILFKE